MSSQTAGTASMKTKCLYNIYYNLLNRTDGPIYMIVEFVSGVCPLLSGTAYPVSSHWSCGDTKISGMASNIINPRYLISFKYCNAVSYVISCTLQRLTALTNFNPIFHPPEQLIIIPLSIHWQSTSKCGSNPYINAPRITRIMYGEFFSRCVHFTRNI